MKHIGLFEGIGGFSYAAQLMGWSTVAWCEWNPFCQVALKYHFPEAEGLNDITQTDFTKYYGTVDILTGDYSISSFFAFSLIAISITPAIESPNFSESFFSSESAFSDKVKDVFFLFIVVIVVYLRYIYGTNIINFIMGNSKNNKYDKAYSLYESGLSLSEVAEILNVSRQGVYKAFKLRGYSLRKMQPREIQVFDGKNFTIRNTGYYGLTTGNRKLMHRYVWEYYNGQIPNGHDVHYKNNNKADNRIENLECLPKSEHTRLYSPHNNQFTAGRKIKGRNA